MHLPEIDKYAELNSVFHSWDPRVKIASLSFLILSLALLQDILSAFLGLVLAVSFVFLSRLPFSFVLKQLRWVIFFSLCLFVVMPLTVPGEEIVGLNLVTISREGLRLSSLIALRAISICMLIFPMMGTMKFHKTLKALEKLKVPHKLIQLTMFTYRYIFVLWEELRRMSVAAKSRLLKKRANIHTLRIMANLIGMLFIRSFERTQRVHRAMVSRGYKGHLITQYEFQLSGKDFFKAFFVIIAALILALTGHIL